MAVRLSAHLSLDQKHDLKILVKAKFQHDFFTKEVQRLLRGEHLKTADSKMETEE